MPATIIPQSHPIGSARIANRQPLKEAVRSSGTPDYVTQLHNLAHSNGWQLRWNDVQDTGRGYTNWESTAIIDGWNAAVGRGSRQSHARQEAARQVLVHWGWIS